MFEMVAGICIEPETIAEGVDALIFSFRALCNYGYTRHEN